MQSCPNKSQKNLPKINPPFFVPYILNRISVSLSYHSELSIMCSYHYVLNNTCAYTDTKEKRSTSLQLARVARPRGKAYPPFFLSYTSNDVKIHYYFVRHCKNSFFSTSIVYNGFEYLILFFCFVLKKNMLWKHSVGIEQFMMEIYFIIRCLLNLAEISFIFLTNCILNKMNPY